MGGGKLLWAEGKRGRRQSRGGLGVQSEQRSPLRFIQGITQLPHASQSELVIRHKVVKRALVHSVGVIQSTI